MKNVISKSATEIDTTMYFKRIAPRRIGAYSLWKKSIILSAKVFLCEIFFDKNKADIMGMYVRESINAPMMAKLTVSAIGLNIFPSIPCSERMGK